MKQLTSLIIVLDDTFRSEIVSFQKPIQVIVFCWGFFCPFPTSSFSSTSRTVCVQQFFEILIPSRLSHLLMLDIVTEL